MHLAILHYHLNPGGVTQVIRNHLRALAGASEIDQVGVFYGGRQAGWADGDTTAFGPHLPELVAVPELDYDPEDGIPSDNPAALAETLRHALSERGMEPLHTVVHVHNHAIGKNAALPGALAELAADGFRLLLQIHDFAEDFRPDNYRRIADPYALYPQGSQVHYAVLNGRDLAILAEAGVAEARLHLLPNPVAPFGDLPDRDVARTKLATALGVPRDRPYLLYPVRGIRRKNVGEIVLWSALLGDTATPAITLRPRNPAESASYDRWSTLAAELRLACRFGAGEEGGPSFPENLAAADAILSTSVAEGFGMVFLEAWLAGQPLMGRDLPEITSDFRDAGVTLPWLYPRLAVPNSLVDVARFQDALAAAYRAACSAYERLPLGGGELKQVLDGMVSDGTVDFALLSGPLQADMIRRAAADGSVRETLLANNPQITAATALGEKSVVHTTRMSIMRYSRYLIIIRSSSTRAVHYLYRGASSRGAHGHDPPEVFLRNIHLIPQDRTVQ